MLLLGVGWFGVQVFWAFHAASMPLFLADRAGSKLEVSLVLSLAGVSGVVVPPIVGCLSDRTRLRFGRRAPYVACGMLGVLICVLALPHTAALGGAALVSGLMYFSLRMAETPFLSLLPDITPREQRATASGVMNLVGSVGLILCFVAGSLVWERDPSAMFALVAAVSFGSTLICAALIREPAAPPAPAAAPVAAWAYLQGLARERNAVRWLVAQFFWWLGFWMVSSFLVLFVTEDLEVAEGRAFLLPLAVAATATVAMLPLGMLGDRVSRKRILTGMIALWAVASVALGLSRSFSEALAIVAISGVPFAAVMAVGYAFFLDLIPEERTAEFVGISVLTIAGAQFAGPLIGGPLIDALGYRSLFPAAAAFQLVGVVLLQLVQPRGAGGRREAAPALPRESA
jgi:Na+/melibiose symporter-like transporter